MKKTVLKVLGWAEFRARMKHRFNPGPGDASQYADDFASNVSWSPMDTQSVLLRRRLVSLGPLALTFSLPSSLKILMAVMPVLITLPMILVVNTWHRFAFIAPFILIPGYLTIRYVFYRSVGRPVFDRKSGTFWKGSSESRHTGSRAGRQSCSPADLILLLGRRSEISRRCLPAERCFERQIKARSIHAAYSGPS